jgi:hypothetical protein
VKRVSELQEGEWLLYSLSHTPFIKVQFVKDYGKTEGYIFTTLGTEAVDGCNLYLTIDILDLLQKELMENGAQLESSYIKPS